MAAAPGSGPAPAAGPAGRAQPAAAMPGGGPPPAAMDDSAPARPLSYGVILRLGKRYLKPYAGLLLVYVVASLLVNTVLPVGVTLSFTTLTNYFQGGVQVAQPAAASGGPALSGPERLVTPYCLYAILTVTLLVLGFGLKWLTAYLDGTVGNLVRRDVFATLLRESPRFFRDHDANSLAIIVNQYCLQVQMALRQLLVDPLLQVIGVIGIGYTLFLKLMQIQHGGGSGVWLFFSIIALFALAAP